MNPNEINPFSEVDKYLNQAIEVENKASTHATATAILVIDTLKQMSVKLSEMPPSEDKEKTLKDIHQKIEILEKINNSLRQSKKTFHSLDLVEKIYQKVKEIKGSLNIENKDAIIKLENHWDHLKNDHTKLNKYFTKAKMHLLDSTMGILSDVQSNKESLQNFLTHFPEEKIQDFTSLKKALKINSFYQSNKSTKGPSPERPVKIYQENQPVKESTIKKPIKPASPPKKVLPFYTMPVPDNKLFLHQHGDFFGKGTALEGENFSNILNYALAFISALKKDQFAALDPEKNNQSKLVSTFNTIESQIQTAITINTLFDGLSTESDLESESQELSNLIQESLKTKGNVLIPGGWAGTPFGHAMLYEVKSNPNGTYNFRVFNRGGGLTHHNNFVKAPHKLLYAPFIEYENITQDNLFNPIFLRGLLEYKIKENNASEYDIYEGLLPLLKGKQKKFNLEMEDLMSPQHSGTCTWKSFCAYLRGQLSYNQYKKFMFSIKQQGLWDYYQENHLSIAADPEKRNLFEKGLQGFSRSLEKIKNGGLISLEEYEDSVTSLLEIKENILLHAIEHLKKLHQNAPIVDCNPLNIEAKWKFSPERHLKKISSAPPPTLQPTSMSVELTNSVKNWKPIAKTVEDDFRLMQKQFNQAKLDGKYDDVCSAFISVMEKISVPEIPPKTVFWKEISSLPPQEVLSIMNSLSEMYDSFFKCSFSLDEPRNHDPKSLAAMYKVLAFQDALIHLTGAENLGMKGMELPPDFYYLGHILGRFPPDSQIPKNRPYYFPLRDPKTKEELSALHDYFTERTKNLGAPLPFQFYHLREEGLTEGSAAGSISSPIIKPELAYIRELLKNEEFVSKIRKQISDFDSLKLHEKIMSVYALNGSGIIPEPFLNYRRQISQLQIFWVEIANFKKTHTHNPDTDLEISLLSNVYTDVYSDESKASISTFFGSKYIAYLDEHHTPSYLFQDDLVEGIASFAANNPYLQNNFINSESYSHSAWLEMIQLVANPEIQITEILAFLIRNPEVLKTEYRVFLEQILFEETLLLKEIRQNPEFFSKLTQFIHKTYLSYQEQGEVEICCYLLNLTNYLHQYKNYLLEKEPALSTFLNQSHPLLDPLTELSHLQQVKSLTTEDQSFIYSHLIAFCSNLEQMDEMLIKKVMIGLAHLSKHPLTKKHLNPAIARGIKKTQQNLTEILPKLSTKTIDQILNYILNNQFSITGQPGWKLEVFPFYICQNEDKTIKANILEGQFFINDEHSTKLPAYVLNCEYYPSYLDLFDVEHPCRCINFNVFELVDTEGNINILKYDHKQKLSVSKIIDGREYCKDSLPSGFPFRTDLHYYQSPDRPYLAYLCDKKGKKHYRVHFEIGDESDDITVKPVKIENLLHSPPLSLVDIFSDEKTYAFLKNFELSTTDIKVWENENKKLQRIELPNFNLSFISVRDPTKKTWQWQCQEIKGFFISKEQFAEPFAKLNFNIFLKLENAKDEIKFLVPKQELIKGSHALIGARKFKIESNRKSFLIYDFNKHPGRFERELKMGPEESLYMAMIALSAGSDEGYRFARHLLDPNKLRIGQVRDKELKILKEIINLVNNNGDHDPRAIALSLHCCYLLFEEMERSDSHFFTPDRVFFVTITHLLQVYASTLQHSQGYHLPLHELKKIGQLAIDYIQKSPDANYFLETIAPDEWSDLSFGIGKKSIVDVHRHLLENFDHYLNDLCTGLNLQQKAAKPRKKEMVCTSSNANFFLENLPVVFHGTPQRKQELRDKLTLQKAHSSHHPHGILYSLMLETILDHHKNFKFIDLPVINWTPEILSSVLKLTKKKYDQLPVDSMIPLSNTSSTPTLRPKTLPEGIKKPSKIPELLFGDRLQTKLESVEPFDSNKYLTKAPAADNTKKEQKLNIVHQEIKTLLGMSAGKIGKKVIERIEEGCTIYLEKQTSTHGKTTFKFNLDKLDELENDLQNQISFHLGSLQQEAIRLCVLADQYISRENPKMHALHKLGATREALTIDDLCLLYAQGTLKDLCGEKVVSEIRFYLEAATHAQKLERSLQRVWDLQKNLHTQDQESAEIALVAEMTKERVIDPAKHPACLVLEYYSNILMHSGQYENMKIFLETGKNYQPIRHMIMGSGKTTVLMRLLALLRADGERLSILVLTDELLESMSEEVRSGSVGTFDQFLLPFDIDRSTKLTVETLQELKDKLERCRTNQGVLILSPQSIHCFYLTFLETCFKSHLMEEGSEKVNILERLGLQREILSLLGTYGSALLDEADILLNCRKEVNFPFGKEMSMPEEEQNLLLDLYEVLIENPEVASLLKCDFSPASIDDKAPLYMEDNYKKKIKPVIVDAMLKKLNLGYLSTQEIAFITTYLLQNGDTEQNKAAEQFVAKLHDIKLKNVLSLLKEELNSLLPTSLEKNCGEHYCFSEIKELSFAIPAINGKPVEGSRFSNAHETGNYTLQTSMKYGIKEHIIFEKLESLKVLCQEEMQKNVAYKDTAAFKEFLTLVGGSEDFHLLKLNLSEKKKIVNKINTEYRLQRQFLKAYILPSIHFHKRKLNSNAHMLARFFNTVLGFSGTLWNADTYPNMLSPQPEHDVDAMSLFILTGHLTNIDNEGKVTKNHNVISIDKTTSDAVIEATENELKSGKNILAIADCGGYLNEDDPSQLADKATKILHAVKPSIKGTAYFDQDANFMIKEHDRPEAEPVSGSTVAKEERLTIYAQRFTTGTDVKQAPNAVALVTIGRKTLLRDLFQTIWRMREVDRGQRIKFIVGRDIEQVIRQKLNIADEEVFSQEHLLRFCLMNQIEQLSDDIVVAAKQKMLNIIQWEVLKVVMDPNISPAHISDLFVSEMKDLFAPKQANTAFELYGKSSEFLDTPVVLEQEKNHYLSLLTQLQNKVPLFKKKIDFNALETQLESLIAKELLPEKALSPMGEKDKQVQVQQKSQVKQQVQQVEVNLAEGDQSQWTFIPWPDVSCDKIFDPNFYNPPSWGKGYLTAKGLTTSTAKAISKNVPEVISGNLPQKSRVLGAAVGSAALYTSYQLFPNFTTSLGIAVSMTVGGFIAAGRFSSTVALSLKRVSDDISSITQSADKWITDEILNKLPSVDAIAEGAPLPYALSDFLKQDSSIKALEKAIDPAITVTHNFAPRKAYYTNMKVIKPFQKQSKKIQELLLIQNKKDSSWKVVIIDKEEAKYFREQLLKDQKKGTKANQKLKICLYNPIIGVIQKGAEEITDDEIQKDKNILKLIVQAKFFNGEVTYTKKEREALKAWIQANDPTKLKEVFRNKIISNLPNNVLIWNRMKDLFPE